MTFATMLTEPITIIHPGETTNAAGDTVPDWTNTTTSTALVHVAPLSGGREAFQKDATEARYKVFMHPFEGIVPEDRLQWGAIILQQVRPPAMRMKPALGLHHLEVYCNEWEG